MWSSDPFCMVWGNDWSSFCFSCGCLIVSVSFDEDYSFPIQLPWHLCQKISGMYVYVCICIGLFLDSIFFSLGLHRYYANSIRWWLLKFYSMFWNQAKCRSFVLFRYCVVLCISIYVLESACQFLKNCLWGFDCDCIESLDKIGENWHVNNFESSSSWTSSFL